MIPLSPAILPCAQCGNPQRLASGLGLDGHPVFVCDYCTEEARRKLSLDETACAIGVWNRRQQDRRRPDGPRG